MPAPIVFAAALAAFSLSVPGNSHLTDALSEPGAAGIPHAPASHLIALSAPESPKRDSKS